MPKQVWPLEVQFVRLWAQAQYTFLALARLEVVRFSTVLNMDMKYNHVHHAAMHIQEIQQCERMFYDWNNTK